MEIRKPVICIDPGHGGWDPGAVGPYGLREKTVTLTVGNYLGDMLESHGAEVIFTRRDDSYVSLGDRVDWANRNKADLFVSIHCNSNAGKPAQGIEVWTSSGETQADAFAEAIYMSLRREFPDHQMRPDWSDSDPDREGNLFVLRKTAMPAVLVECEFINNPDQEHFLAHSGNQKRIAEAICRGIVEAAPSEWSLLRREHEGEGSKET